MLTPFVRKQGLGFGARGSLRLAARLGAGAGGAEKVYYIILYSLYGVVLHPYYVILYYIMLHIILYYIIVLYYIIYT